MRSRLAAALALVALLTVGVTAAPAAPTPQTPQLTQTKASEFPNRNYVLTLPHAAQVDPGAIAVFENGKPVDSPQVDLPGQTGSANVGVVLVIDTSLSMKGEAIKQAMAAARAFTDNRASQEQLGTIFFNSKTKVALPLTTDDGAIGAVLHTTPPLAFGTHINDALQAAVTLLDNGGVDIGSIVLLSDGRDVGSKVKEPQVLAAAKRSHIRIFSVGLRSPSFTPRRLSRLAEQTGGTFTIASSPASLTKIYSALSLALSNEYQVSYRSLAGPAQQVYVSVRIPGIAAPAETSYRSPGLPAGSTVGQKSWWDRFIQSTFAASLVVVIVVALLGLAVFMFVRRRDRRFQRRLSRFVDLPPEEQARIRREDIAESLEEPEQRERWTIAGWYRNFEEEVELARIDMNPTAIAILTVAGALVVGGVCAALVSSGWGLLVGLLVPVIVRWFVGWRLRRIRNEFAEQLPDNLDVVSSALRAGHSLVGALTVTVEASSEPSRSELGRALADEQLGVPLDDALRVVAKRMDNRDLIQVAMVSMLQREAGTNAAEVLERVSENVRNQMDLKRLVRTLTAQGRMARWIVSFLPLFLFLALFLINRDYLAPLWETTGGIVAMCVAGVMVVTGSLIIKRIVEIEA
jgi:tight adherence protein B